MSRPAAILVEKQVARLRVVKNAVVGIDMRGPAAKRFEGRGLQRAFGEPDEHTVVKQDVVVVVVEVYDRSDIARAELSAEIEAVVARPTDQRVVARPAVQPVVARAAIEIVVTIAAVEVIVARARADGVGHRRDRNIQLIGLARRHVAGNDVADGEVVGSAVPGRKGAERIECGCSSRRLPCRADCCRTMQRVAVRFKDLDQPSRPPVVWSMSNVMVAPFSRVITNQSTDPAPPPLMVTCGTVRAFAMSGSLTSVNALVISCAVAGSWLPALTMRPLPKPMPLDCTGQHVAEQAVVAGTTEQPVVACPAGQFVVAAQTFQSIGAFVADQQVVARRANRILDDDAVGDGEAPLDATGPRYRAAADRRSRAWRPSDRS